MEGGEGAYLRCGVVCFGMGGVVWYGLVWCGMMVVCCGMVWYDLL